YRRAYPGGNPRQLTSEAPGAPYGLGRRESRSRDCGLGFGFSVRDGAAAGLRSVALLLGAVRRADERAGEDRAEAERLALLPEPAELVGVHPTVDRRVLGRGLQILADRHDIDPVSPKVAHRLHDLVVRLAQADDDSRLR